MSISRRSFLKAGLLLGVAASLPLAVARAVLAQTRSLADLTLADFSARLSSSFRVQTGGGQAVWMQLVEAADRGSSRAQEQFSLVFRGPLATPLGQGTYHFLDRRWGAFDLFIVPGGEHEGGRDFEACFNRLRA